MVGGFETAECKGGRSGVWLRQAVPEEPTSWKTTKKRPFTIVGNLDWSDYRVSSDVLLEQAGSVDLIGRLTGMSGADVPNSYVLRVANTGDWSLLKTVNIDGEKDKKLKDETVLAQGKVSALGVNSWHNLRLTFQGSTITAEIDHVAVKTIADASYAKGMAGIGTVSYVLAEFDNFKVEPVSAK
jgi:hypothetical protein